MEMLISMKFLVGISPLFEQYLKVFQSEGPLVFLIFTEMKSSLTTLLKHFVNLTVVDEAREAKQLIDIDVVDTANIHDLSKIDFGLEAKAELMEISDEKKRKSEDTMILQCDRWAILLLIVNIWIYHDITMWWISNSSPNCEYLNIPWYYNVLN